MTLYRSVGRVRSEVKRRTLTTWLDPLVAGVAEVVEYLAPKIAPRETEAIHVRLASGQGLFIPPGLPSARRLASGDYEPEVTDALRSVASEGRTVVDVGANVGYHTLNCAVLVGKAGRVYAFEPNPDVFRYLALNVTENGAANVVTVPLAVARTSGLLAFERPDLERGYLSDRLSSNTSSLMIEAVSLDDYFRQQGWPTVDLIKIDIEGAESSALRGMTELSRRNPEMQVVLEFNLSAIRRAGESAESLREALWGLGFRTANVVEKRGKPFSLATRLPRSWLVYNLIARKQ